MTPAPAHRVRVIGVVVLGLLTLGADPIQVYQPRFRTPAELAPLASDLLGSDGIAVADPGGRALVLRGAPESVARVLEALRQLDRPAETYQIEFRLTREIALRRLGIDLRDWHTSAEIRLAWLPSTVTGISRLPLRSMLAMGEQRSAGRIAALEGQPAELWLGTAYPEIQRAPGTSQGETRTLDSRDVQALATGFRVTPRTLHDGRLELEIAPLIAQGAPGEPIVRAGLSTRLAGRPGRWLAVASASRRGGAVSLDPFGSLDLRAGASDSVLLLRAHSVDSRELLGARGRTPPDPSTR